MKRTIFFSALLGFSLWGAVARWQYDHRLLAKPEWLYSRPAPFNSDDDYSPQAIADVYDTHWTYDAEHSYWLPDDYTSTATHIAAGFRRTVGYSRPDAPRLWMFGSSTLYGSYVTDEQTIPSLLQSRMPQYRVVNVGMSSAGIVAEYERLTTVGVQAGDIALFYDGAIDCGYGAERMPLFQDYLNRAQAYAKAQRVAFYHVLQPLYPLVQRTDYQRAVAANHYLVEDGYLSNLASVVNICESAPHVLNLAHLLDSGDYFLDQYHVNATANHLIADAIYQRIEVF